MTHRKYIFDSEAEKALDALLKILNKEWAKQTLVKEIIKGCASIYNPISYCRDRKTRHNFWGIGKLLGLHVVTDVFIVEMDTSAQKYIRLCEYVEKQYVRYDSFEFDGNDECFIAFD